MNRKAVFPGDEEIGDRGLVAGSNSDALGSETESRLVERASRAEIQAAYDEAFAELIEEERERVRRGEPPPPERPLEPHVAEALAALNAMFGENYHLTADLSFDQVYAKVLPHLVTIGREAFREQHALNHEEDPE